MITLALMEKEDFKKVVEWNEGKSADYLLQWSGPVFEHPLTIEKLSDFYSQHKINEEGADTFAYKIVLKETGEMVGTIELRESDKENKVGRIGRFLIGDEKVRGKGIGAKALNEALRIGFQELGYAKIALGVFDFNHSAIKCYENTGFIKIELKENYRKATNGYWHLYEMAISKEEWEKRK